MKILLSSLLFLHGAIHLLGFAKGFQWAQTESLPGHISRVGGLFWLVAFLLFSITLTGFLTKQGFWPFTALAAVFVSSVLILQTWSSARFGTVPNMLVLLWAVAGLSSCSMNKMIARETDEILSVMNHVQPGKVTLEQVQTLPAPVSRWLIFSGIIDKPMIHSARVKQSAWMKMKPEQEEWYPAKAIQYTTTETPAFIWSVEMKMSPLMHIRGRDKYTRGKGEMLIKLNGLLNIVNAQGEKMDEGTLQRFLGEMVWFPSLALSPYISWEAIDEHSARATMSYGDTSGSGIFWFNDQGDFVKFMAMRYKGNDADAQRYPWVLTVQDYAVFEGIRVPSQMQAAWQLEKGDWTWLKLTLDQVQYNVNEREKL